MIDPGTAVRGNTRHPIFIRATGTGAGGIATLVIDGEGCLSRLEPLIRPQRDLKREAGNLGYCRLADSFGRIVDEVVLAVIDYDDSATGNPQVELSCHGGAGAVAAVEDALLEAGFQRGRDSELMERAHLNGKLSLIEIEARMRLARAATARQAELLLSHVELQQKWERMGFDMAMGLRTRDLSWREKMFDAVNAALGSASAALALLKQHRVAIIGAVNAGKSTLANRLARSDRHIVSAIPGTTLDRLDTAIDLRGLHLLISDTAGFRESNDAVEREGQLRSQQAARTADLRLLVLDGSQAPGDMELEMISPGKDGALFVVLNKKDLGLDEAAVGLGFLAGREPFQISARDGEGIADLEAAMEMQLLGGGVHLHGAPFTQRQLRHLHELQQGLQTGSEGVELLVPLRKLIGSRPDPRELDAVLGETAAGGNARDARAIV